MGSKHTGAYCSDGAGLKNQKPNRNHSNCLEPELLNFFLSQNKQKTYKVV